MIKKFFQNLTDVIIDELFPKLCILSIIMFILGCFVAVIDISEKKQCDEMSITEDLKYPYCRNYFEEQLKNMVD